MGRVGSTVVRSCLETGRTCKCSHRRSAESNMPTLSRRVSTFEPAWSTHTVGTSSMRKPRRPATARMSTSMRKSRDDRNGSTCFNARPAHHLRTALRVEYGSLNRRRTAVTNAQLVNRRPRRVAGVKDAGCRRDAIAPSARIAASTSRDSLHGGVTPSASTNATQSASQDLKASMSTPPLPSFGYRCIVRGHLRRRAPPRRSRCGRHTRPSRR